MFLFRRTIRPRGLRFGVVALAPLVALTAVQAWPTASEAQTVGRTLYVSLRGNNTDGLSKATAFTSLQAAADVSRPGDTIVVSDGPYVTTKWWEANLQITRSGTAAQPITYRAAPGERPLIKAAGWAGITVSGAAYIRIEGFDVEGSANSITETVARSVSCLTSNDRAETGAAWGDGISIGPNVNSAGTPVSRAHHVTIHDNRVHDFGGGGIGAIGADYLTIENNVSYGNARWSPYGTSGISVYQLWNSDGVGGSDGDLPYKNVIRNNSSYENRNVIGTVINPDTGVCNASAATITDGNGIIIDDARNSQPRSYAAPGPYRGRTLVENNVVSSNGGRGINVFSSDHVDVVNNTSAYNALSDDTAMVKSDITSEVSVVNARDVEFVNNVIVARNDREASLVYSTNGTADTSTVRFDRNLVFGGTAFASGAGANNIVGRDPLFVDPMVGDFALQATSPGVDAGLTSIGRATAPLLDRFYQPRPQGNGVDLGAFESSATAAVSTTVPTSLSTTPPRRRRR
jgi:hypothetical protein